MRKYIYSIFVVVLSLASCSVSQKNNSTKDSFSKILYGYWISSDQNYNIDDIENNKKTVLYFGEIKNGKGLFKQNEKDEKYSIVLEDKSNKTIEVMLHFNNGVNRKEKLILSNNYTHLESIIITPDSFKISTYYVKDDK